ncbi:MAG: hypothetical protein Q9227_003066 [Pyrenula ochraceoflavens]
MDESYAVLGATGNTGGSLLKILAKDPNKKIHAFVRSAAKLEKQQPDVFKTAQLRVFEGNISNIDVLADCIRGTKAIFLAIAGSDNVPYCHLSQDAASSVVSALEKIRNDSPGSTLPRLVVLSSSSLDKHLERHIPGPVRYVLHLALYWIYTDLAIAERFLREQTDWLDCVFVKPGGLVSDQQRGHAISLDRQKTFLSFLDLAAGMVEIADTEGDQLAWKNVSVVPTSNDTRIEWWVPYYLVRGLVFTYFPKLYTLTQ